jgi:hypothetical protein
MSDLISRKEVLKHIEKIRQGAQMMDDIRRASIIMNGMDLCEEAVRNQPSAQPVRLKGRWIERNPQNSDKCRLIECDQCGFSHIVGFNVPYEHWIENRNFCERCGADMRCEDDDIPIEYFENGGI